jgi:transcriptional regulator with XRE-family HTH domain
MDIPSPEYGRVIRAARRARGVSQRELAALAGVPVSTVGRIEADATTPRLPTFTALLDALGYRLVVVDAGNQPLQPDDDHDRLIDAGGRRFPAHLPAEPTPGYFERDGGRWWGWERIAWPFGPGRPPEHTYWRRCHPYPVVGPTIYDTAIWDDAT